MTSATTRRERVMATVESARFQHFIIGVIVANAITLGLETSDAVMGRVGGALHALDRFMLAVFLIEIGLRIYAHRLRFFRDPWSIFDVLVVGVSLVPATSTISVLRAVRALRALRLVSVVPGMKRVVNGLLSAIPGMLSIIVLLGLVLYVSAVLATELYGRDSPDHFGDLGSSLFTLFQVMTGEAWPDIAAQVLEKHPTAWIFFVLYILISTFIVLNLFTAVVVSAMESQPRPDDPEDEVLRELRELRAEIAALRADRS